MRTLSERLLNCSAQYLRVPLDGFIDAQLANGNGQADIFAAVPHMLIDRYGCAECAGCAEALRKAGVSVPVFSAKPYGYSLFLETYSNLGEASVLYYRNCLRAARVFGAKTLCLYPANGIWDERRERLIDNATDALRHICAEAAASGIRVALGTALRSDAPALQTLPELQEVLRRVKSEWLGALMDTHVVYRAGETPGQWLDALKGRLFHVRLADGQSDGYRVWGEGGYPLRETLGSLEAAGYDGLISLYCPSARYAARPDAAEQANRQAVEQAVRSL